MQFIRGYISEYKGNGAFEKAQNQRYNEAGFDSGYDMRSRSIMENFDCVQKRHVCDTLILMPEFLPVNNLIMCDFAINKYYDLIGGNVILKRC